MLAPPSRSEALKQFIDTFYVQLSGLVISRHDLRARCSSFPRGFWRTALNKCKPSAGRMHIELLILKILSSIQLVDAYFLRRYQIVDFTGLKSLNSFLIFNVFSEFADPPFFSGLRQRCNIRAFASRGPCNGEPSRIYSRTIDFEGSILGCTNGGIPISRVIQLILLISHSSAGSVDSCAPFFEIRTHFRGWISLRLSVQEVGKSVGLYCSRDEFLLVADAISREVNVFVTFVVCRSLRKRMSRSAP